MLINEFLANRKIFITGGTGFLGKALIEKLLRDAPKIKILYIMMRVKKSLSIEERLREYKKDKVFERINQECPEVLNKLYAIEGDNNQLGLGIKPADLSLLQDVSIIFHMAANVKFDDPIRRSILTNTRGTHELIKIALNLKNLVVFQHCSTAYCNPFEDVVEEKVYEMSVDWRKTIKIAETYDEDTMNALSYKYSGFYPNSYTFSKNLSEQLLKEYSDRIPLCIFRPSVVMSAYKEPAPGWIDNMNGPVASLIGCSIGLLPVAQGRGDLVLDSISSDMVSRLSIVAAYKRAMQHLRKEVSTDGFDVINCAANKIFDLSFNTASHIYCMEGRKNPMENKIWDYDRPLLTKYYYNFLFKMLIMNIPLFIIIDTILRLQGLKPKMISMARRIVYVTKALEFYGFKNYDMINKNMLDLEDYIPESELPIYGVKADFLDPDYFFYFQNALSGIKYYLFNQPREATDGARKRAKILFIVSRSIKLLTFLLVIRYLSSVILKF